MYQKSWSYATLFLRYGGWQMQLFFILGHFLPLYTPNSPKNKNLIKMKKQPGDIIILHKCTKNYDQMMYSSWDMVHDRCNCYFLFWAIFCPFTPLTAQKNQNFEKIKKNTWRYHHFTQMYEKSWSYAMLFLRYGA